MWKPSWDDAPEWARWLAMDKSCMWHWFGPKPHPTGDWWTTYPSQGWTHEIEFAGQRIDESCSDLWKESLEGRPTVNKEK